MTFKALDRDQKLDHLLNFAHRTLQHFGMQGATLTMLNYTNNAVYAVEGDTKAILRVHRPNNRTHSQIAGELAWLNTIRRDTTLRVPQPLAEVYTGDLTEDEQTYAVLFGWITGESKRAVEMTPAQSQQLGAFIGHLHNHSEQIASAGDFNRPALNWEGIFGKQSPYQSDAENELFTDEQRTTLQQVAAKVRETMDMIGTDTHNYGMIHADMIAKNVLFDGDDIAVIDFDDCATGYFLYDLAPFLWGAHYAPVYRQQRQALWEGYSSIRPQSPDHMKHIDAFVAARHVASCRWVAGNIHNPKIREQAPFLIDARVEELQHFLESGELHTGERVHTETL